MMSVPVDRGSAARRFLPPFMLACLLVMIGLLPLGTGCSDGTTTIVGPGYDPFPRRDPHLVIELPVHGEAQLYAAWVEPSGEAWLSGSGGLVIHHRDGRWEQEATGTDATLTALVSSADGLLALGAQGTILRRQGEQWRREESPTRAALLAATTNADGEVWGAGRAGSLLRRDPDGWHTVETPTSTDLVCLAVHGDTLLAGGGLGGLWWRTDGVWSVPGEVPAENIQNVAFSQEAGWFLITDRALYRLVSESTWDRILSGGSNVLCAVDSLLYSGSLLRFDLSVAGLPWQYMSPPFHVAGLHAAGPNALLIFGGKGEICWYDAEKDSFAMDAASQLRDGQVVRCLDGSLLLRDSRDFLTKEGDRWQHGISLPPDDFGSDIRGLDAETVRDYHCLRRGSSFDPEYHTFSLLDHAVNGHWQATVQVAGDVRGITLTRDGVLLLTMDKRVYRVEGSTWVLENGLPAAYDEWHLFRTYSGDIYAARSHEQDDRPAYRRADGIWTPVLTLGEPFHYWTYAVAGHYPEALYIFSLRGFLGLHRTQTDSVLVEESYRNLVGLEENAVAWAEGAAGVYIATAYPGYVLLLSGVPGSHRLEIVAGPLLDDVTSMAVGPDGSLVLVSQITGRLYRLPAEALVP